MGRGRHFWPLGIQNHPGNDTGGAALGAVAAVAAAALGAAALALALSPAAAPPLSLAARPAAVTRRTALRGARPEWGPAGLDRPSPLGVGQSP